MNKVSDNPLKNRAFFDTSLMVVTAIFVTLYLVSNVMAVKVIGIFGLFYFDVGTLTARDLLMMILFQYFSKLAIEAIFGTPMAYALVHAINKYIDRKTN